MKISDFLLVTRKKLFLFFALVFIVSGVWFYRSRIQHNPNLRTATIHKGDLLVSVSATGTIEPEEVIDVGAQVAGQILSFGTDKDGKSIDYGSIVEEGTVLARIDESLYASDVAQAEAQLKKSQADLLQLQAKLTQAEKDWRRVEKLNTATISPSTYDGYKAGFDIAQANLTVGEASVTQAQASLDRSKRNLSYCIISSPVKGVIIDRRVNIGQTVVSSLNAPSLFLIAKDLKKMQVWVSVNETDIGLIHPGQQVSFTVDTFPLDTFKGTVKKIRLNATMTQNVVTYTVEVETDNSSGKLLPYLTANAKFEVENRTDVFLVPNSALRWMPKTEQISPEFRQQFDGDKRKNTSKADQSVLWAEDGSFVKPIRLRASGTDSTFTEVSGDAITDGMEVVIGEQFVQGKTASGASPFAPQLMGGKR